jgi:cytochrome c oxidase accessory protein FixG
MSESTASVGADEAHQTFRDALASVHQDGRRKWIYARQPSGRFYTARTLVAIVLLAFLVGAPFVHVNGQPLILLNVLERRFVLFGLVFWPQDFALVVLLALTAIVTLALSTAAVGRVWCGWLCPQTVFLEMVFRRIEYLIDGSAEQQVRRDGAPWTTATWARAAVKHAIFFALSFGIANVFLSYIIGIEQLWIIVTDPPARHLAGLTAITIFSLLFYGVFARFREQACVLACPYGRVMSSLIDARTVTVTYDARRGEPRGPVTRQPAPAAAAAGDCVDCARCVTVCPTGIDIRNGIQLECVNCTACMDACDDVMDRLRRPRGLIRLTSHDAMQQGRATWLNRRVLAYAVVWLVLVAGVTTLVARRDDLDVLILRQAGTLDVTLPDDAVGNFYTVQVFNRTRAAVPFSIAVAAPAASAVTPLGLAPHVEPYGLSEGRVLVAIPSDRVAGAATAIRFVVRVPGEPDRFIDSSYHAPGVSRRRPPAAPRRAQRRD